MRKIHVTIRGGLGNQMFQFFAAYGIDPQSTLILKFDPSKKGSVGESSNILNWSLPGNYVQSKSKYENLIILKITNLLLRVSSIYFPKRFLKLRSFVISIPKLILHLKYRNLKIIIPNGVGFDSNLVIPEGDLLLIGYFQSARWFEDVSSDVRGINLMNNYHLNGEVLSEINKSNSIILQIRRGDYEAEKKIGMLPIDFFSIALRGTYFDSIEKCFIFSNDSPSVLKKFQELNLSFQITIADQGLSASESLEMLRHGRTYIISNSTFGWWGAFLSYTQNPTVLYPNPWFKGMKSPIDIAPGNWIGVRSWS